MRIQSRWSDTRLYLSQISSRYTKHRSNGKVSQEIQMADMARGARMQRVASIIVGAATAALVAVSTAQAASPPRQRVAVVTRTAPVSYIKIVQSAERGNAR